MRRVVLLTCVVAFLLVAASGAMASSTKWVVFLTAGFNDPTQGMLGATGVTVGGWTYSSQPLAPDPTPDDANLGVTEGSGTWDAADLRDWHSAFVPQSWQLTLTKGAYYESLWSSVPHVGDVWIGCWTPDKYAGKTGNALLTNWKVRVTSLDGNTVYGDWTQSSLLYTGTVPSGTPGKQGFWLTNPPAATSTVWWDANAVQLLVTVYDGNAGLYPAVTITSPTDQPDYLTATASVDLAGTAASSTGLANVSWSNNRGGSGICSGTTSWNATGIPLSEGNNIITVTAQDSTGLTGTDTITVNRDISPPTVAITGPTANPAYATSSATLNLSGTAADAHGVESVTWSNDRGGGGTCAGTTTWSASAAPLAVGTNVITISAVDSVGNVGTATLTANYDTTPPEVTITGPTADSAYSTDAPTLSVSGTSSDAGGVASVTWSNSRGGGGSCSGTTSWSAANVPLAPEANIITVTALDQAGNSASDTITVTRLPVSVGAARSAPEGSSVFISDAVVTANSLETGSVFVGASDHSAGVKLVTDQSLSVGQKVKCSGTLARVNGEYQITGVTFQETMDATPLTPSYMNTRSVSSDPTESLTYSSGMNTTGLLVTTSGNVTGVVTSQNVAYIDDGGNCEDGYGPVLGMRIHVSSGVSTTWNHKKVCVTGVSRVPKFTLIVWGNVSGDWYPPGTVVYVPYIDALTVTFL